MIVCADPEIDKACFLSSRTALLKLTKTEMSGIYASTTLTWFENLARLRPTLAAFWQPTPAQPHHIQLGERWYFKELGAPQLLGFGEFSGWEVLTASQIYDTYGSACGYATLRELIDAVRDFDPGLSGASRLGNVILQGFTAFPSPIALSAVALRNLTARFAYLEREDPIAAYVGGAAAGARAGGFLLRSDVEARKSAAMRKARVGQSSFRRLLLNVYGNVCAFTGKQIEEVLQAAHIQPYVDAASNHVENGLLLKADIHMLFDLGLLTISDRFKIAVSPRLLGRSPSIDALDGAAPHLGNALGVTPSRDALRFHRDTVFQPF